MHLRMMHAMRTPLPPASRAHQVARYLVGSMFALTLGCIIVALLMSAPGEFHMAVLAGFGRPWSYGAPAVLTVYALVAVVATSYAAWAQRRWSPVAVFTCTMAIVMAAVVQTTAHLISAGYLPAHSIGLVVTVSAVPSVASAHMAHLTMHLLMHLNNSATGGDAGGIEEVHGDQADAEPDAQVAPHALPSDPPEVASLHLVTVAEAHHASGVPEPTIRSWARRGLIERVDAPGGRVLVDVHQVRDRMMQPA